MLTEIEKTYRISRIKERVTALEGENAQRIIDSFKLERRSEGQLWELAFRDDSWLQAFCASTKFILENRFSENRFLMSTRANPSSSSSSSGVDGGIDFQPPLSSQPLPRNLGNRLLESTAATTSLTSGLVRSSHFNSRSCPSSSSSSGGDGGFGLTSSGFSPSPSSPSLSRIWEDGLLESVNSRHYNSLSWPFSSSSYSGVDDLFGPTPFDFPTPSLSRSRSIFLESAADTSSLISGTVSGSYSNDSSSGSGTKSVQQQQEEEKEQTERFLESTAARRRGGNWYSRNACSCAAIRENTFLESTGATPSLTSGSVSSSHSNSSSCPTSSSSSGVDGASLQNKDDASLQKSSLGIQETGSCNGSSTKSVQQQEEEEQTERGNVSSSTAATPSLTSCSVSSSHSNSSSCLTSSSSSGVDGDFSLSENKDDATLQKSSLGIQETGSCSGSGTKSVQQQEQEKQTERRSSNPWKQNVKDAEKKNKAILSHVDFPVLDGKITILRKKQLERVHNQNLNKGQQTAPPPDTAPLDTADPPETENAAPENDETNQEESETENAAPENDETETDNLHGSTKKSDETNQEESEKEKSTTVDDSCENKEETSGMSESARQETAGPPETTAPGNLHGSSKNSDETHQEESKKSTPVDDSEENKEETSGMSESARQETTVPPETAAPNNLPGSSKNSDETHKKESEKEKSTLADDSEENK